MVFAMVGLAGMVALGVFGLNNSDSITNTTGGDAGVRDNSCTGLLYPNITDEAKYIAAIDEYIPDSSPLNGLGKYFVSGGKKSGINPSLIVAQAKKESSFGTAGVATKGINNAFGRTATSSQPNMSICNKFGECRLWYKWSAWWASLDSTEDDEPTYIKRKYIEEFGITNLDDYIARYAPASDGNDPISYTQTVRQIMQQIADKSNGAVTCQ